MFIWQDILLIAIAVIFSLRWTYNYGYKRGKEIERYNARQLELEKNGNFFWCNGHRVAYPPTPKNPPKKV